MIKVEIPYYYEVEHTPPRKRNPVREIFKGTVPVEIEEVSFPDAALVADWGDPHPGIDVKNELYKYEDNFFEKKTNFRKDITSDNINIDHLTVSRPRTMGPTEGNTEEPNWERVRSMEGEYAAENWPQKIESIKQQAIDYAQKHIFIDSILYKTTALPNIIAEISYYISGATTSISIGDSSERTGMHGMMFSLLEHDAALDWCNQIQSEKNQNHNEIKKPSDRTNLVIYQPELLPDTDYSTQESMRIFTYLMDNNWDIHKLDDNAIDAWQISRSRFKIAQESPSEINIDKLFEAWLEFFDAHEVSQIEYYARIESTYSKFESTHYTSLVAAKNYWDNRSISISPQTDTPFGLKM